MDKDYYVYAYEHVDDNRMMLSLDEYKKEFSTKSDEAFDSELENIIKPLLRQAGWEGDGVVQMTWIPPFCTSYYATSGFFVYHVKQINNGTSYIYSPYELESIKDREVNV
mgnify:CR=1 FL=1|nr:MAG TPA: hypothetical protein [Caudoviricetes sp.]